MAAQTVGTPTGLRSNGTLILIFVVFLLAGRDPHKMRTGMYAEVESTTRRHITAKFAFSAAIFWPAFSRGPPSRHRPTDATDPIRCTNPCLRHNRKSAASANLPRGVFSFGGLGFYKAQTAPWGSLSEWVGCGNHRPRRKPFVRGSVACVSVSGAGNDCNGYES